MSAETTTVEGPLEPMDEAYFVFLVAGIGFLANLVQVIFMLVTTDLRCLTSAYHLHGCALNCFKCGLIIPFGTAMLTGVRPEHCDIVGGAYTVVVSTSGFNLVAIACAEAYSFGEKNTGAKGGGTVGCVLFGVTTVWVCSIICHLGPTIIAGHFDFNTEVRVCMLVLGETKTYIVFIMWGSINCVALAGAIYYLITLRKHARAQLPHRIASLVRDTIPRPHRLPEDTVVVLVGDTMQRLYCVAGFVASFVLCWYPLFICLVADRAFSLPIGLYKGLLLLASSDSAFQPLSFFLLHPASDLCRKLCCSKIVRNRLRKPPLSDSHLIEIPDRPLAEGSPEHRASMPLVTGYVYSGLDQQTFARIGDRLCNNGRDIEDMHPEVEVRRSLTLQNPPFKRNNSSHSFVRNGGLTSPNNQHLLEIMETSEMSPYESEETTEV